MGFLALLSTLMMGRLTGEASPPCFTEEEALHNAGQSTKRGGSAFRFQLFHRSLDKSCVYVVVCKAWKPTMRVEVRGWSGAACGMLEG